MKNFKHIHILIFLICLMGCNGLKAQINTSQIMTIGKNALYFEDYVLSIQYFNQVINVKPYLAEPYFYRAVAKMYLEDYRGAEADATNAIERNKFITDAYQVRGIARQSLNKNEEAIEDYKSGLEQLPENRTFLLNKAVAEEAVKKYGDSEKSYAHLINLYPKFENGYIGRAQLYLAKGDTVAAMADLNKCLEITKTNPTVYVLRADVVTKRDKDYVAALKDMDEAIKLEPHYAGYFINRAYLKYNNDDYFGAMSDYDYAISLEPDNVVAYFNRGLLLMEVRDNNKAISDFSYVISRDPHNIGARFNRADLYYHSGQYRKALKDYDALLTKIDDMPGLYYMRSECKRLSGDISGGMKDYDRSKALISKLKYRGNKNVKVVSPESLSEAPETEEDVKRKFKTLLTIKNDNDVKPEYANKARGKVQDNSFAIEAEPPFMLSYYAVDDELRPRSNYARELNEINEAHLLNNNLVITAAGCVLTEAEINKHFASIDYFTSLISNKANRAIDYFGRAIDYIIVKNYDAAISDLDKAIELSPKFTLAYFARANARYYHSKMIAEPSSDSKNTEAERMMRDKQIQQELLDVIQDYDKVLDLSPKMVYALYNKGCVYLDLQDNTSAVSAFSKVIELRADYGEAYYNCGLAYLRLGNKDAGIANLSKAGEHGITPSYSVLKKMTKY